MTCTIFRLNGPIQSGKTFIAMKALSASVEAGNRGLIVSGTFDQARSLRRIYTSIGDVDIASQHHIEKHFDVKQPDYLIPFGQYRIIVVDCWHQLQEAWIQGMKRVMDGVLLNSQIIVTGEVA